MKRLGIIAFFCCISIALWAQKEHSIELAVGGANTLDTYLSPEKYKGVEIRLDADFMRESRKHPITYLMTHELAYGDAKNRVHNATMLTGHYAFSYGVMRKWTMMEGRLTLRAGGMADFYAGFAYCKRNTSNNPAQGYGAANIGPEVMAQYSFTLWKKNMRVNYAMRMPWLGLAFSPNYGQSYYEIFTRDNYEHNIVFTSLATFQMLQQLSLDIDVSRKCSVRVGYMADIRQAKPNNLKQHHYFNAASVGIVIRK